MCLVAVRPERSCVVPREARDGAPHVRKVKYRNDIASGVGWRTFLRGTQRHARMDRGAGARGIRRSNGTIHLHIPDRSLVNMDASAGTEQGASGIRRPRSHIQPGPCVHRPGGALRTQAPDPQQPRWSRSSGMTVIPALVVARPSGVAGPSPPVDGRGCVECQAVATRVTDGVGASLRYPARLLHPSPDHGRAGRDVRDAPRRFPCVLAVAAPVATAR